MLLFSLESLLDYVQCYEWLKTLLHPSGLSCCGCTAALPPSQSPHKYNQSGLPSYRCRHCGGVFNIFSKTIFQGIHYSCPQIILILRGISQGHTTQHLSRELKLNYGNLLNWRHVLQEFAYENRSNRILPDQIVESDEVFINAGEKGELHPDPDDPPRVRANQKRG